MDLESIPIENIRPYIGRATRRELQSLYKVGLSCTSLERVKEAQNSLQQCGIIGANKKNEVLRVKLIEHYEQQRQFTTDSECLSSCGSDTYRGMSTVISSDEEIVPASAATLDRSAGTSMIPTVPALSDRITSRNAVFHSRRSVQP